MRIEFITSNQDRVSNICSFIENWENDLDFIESTTSGSTGKPKTIRLLKKHMIASAQMTGEFLGLEVNDSALLCMSINTIAGKMMIVRAIVLELILIVTDVSSAPLKGIDRKIDFAAMVPLQVEGSLAELSQIRTLIVGGGEISSHLWGKILESDVQAFQTFGMTETISHIAMRKISKNQTNYKLLPGIIISTVEHCLKVDAESLGVNDLQTNDLIEIEGDGTFSWLGRKDFVINSGGIKIHPEELEKKLEEEIDHPFFVFGLPDNSLGEKLVLCVEGPTNLDHSNFEVFSNKYHIPKEIYFFNEFSRTESGKVNRIKTIERIIYAKKQVL